MVQIFTIALAPARFADRSNQLRVSGSRNTFNPSYSVAAKKLEDLERQSVNLAHVSFFSFLISLGILPIGRC